MCTLKATFKTNYYGSFSSSKRSLISQNTRVKRAAFQNASFFSIASIWLLGSASRREVRVELNLQISVHCFISPSGSYWVNCIAFILSELISLVMSLTVFFLGWYCQVEHLAAGDMAFFHFPATVSLAAGFLLILCESDPNQCF